MRAANPERFKLSVALSLEPTNDQKFVQDLIEADADAFFERLMDDGGAADGSGNGGGGNGSGSGSRRGRTQFYLCGLKRMYAGVLERLEALGKVRFGAALMRCGGMGRVNREGGGGAASAAEQT